MKQQAIVVASFLGLLLLVAPPASALQCYVCVSGESWSDCQAKAVKENCVSVRQVTVLDQNVFLPAPEARQLELACLSLSAQGTLGGTTGYAYVRQCFYNDKSMCSLIQAELPDGFKVKDCDLCTTDLCNGASSVTIAVSSLLLVAVALMLRK